MFNHPELWGSRDYMCDVSQDDLTAAQTHVIFRTPVCCDPVVYDMCISVMVEDGLSLPNSTDEAVILFIQLRRRITRL
jgi:hypothetical protein